MTEPPDLSDDVLFDAWVGGDLGAGQVLFTRYHLLLGHYFNNKVGAEADDLVQQTLLRCVEAHDRFRRESGFRTFLVGIARNVLLEHFRKSSRRAAVRDFDEGELSVEEIGTSPSGVVARGQEQQLVRDALRRVPLISQEILELHYWEDMSTRELAEVLAISQGAVKSRLRRARAHLLEQLGRISLKAAVLERTTAELDRWIRSLRLSGTMA